MKFLTKSVILETVAVITSGVILYFKRDSLEVIITFYGLLVVLIINILFEQFKE